MDFVKDRVIESHITKDFRIFALEPPHAFTGVWVTYYANGQTWLKAGYKTGTLFGDYTCYFPDGTILRARRYSLLGAQGESTDYYPDGKVASRTYFENSKPAGIWTWYNEDGTILSQENHSKTSVQ
jgi:antitoxin component YwqK of YwqJK toxin-antitoxin module